ncbi:hypothetical protein [Thioclava sp. F28-4]|uniref:hypothetical protein n=1 Tax=Thioclava sp. F28-4 TaxID=1915315 RepID=UPI0011BAE079|nr:hypothetical protein [Thioclava sp. F28-4]
MEWVLLKTHKSWRNSGLVSILSVFFFYLICIFPTGSADAEGWSKEDYVCPDLGREMTRIEAMKAFRAGMIERGLNVHLDLPEIDELLAQDFRCCGAASASNPFNETEVDFWDRILSSPTILVTLAGHSKSGVRFEALGLIGRCGHLITDVASLKIVED